MPPLFCNCCDLLLARKESTFFWILSGQGIGCESLSLTPFVSLLQRNTILEPCFRNSSLNRSGEPPSQCAIIITCFQAWFEQNLEAGSAVYIEDSIWLVIQRFNLINEDLILLAVEWALMMALMILRVTFSSYNLLLKLWITTARMMSVRNAYSPHYNLWLLSMLALNPVFSLMQFLRFDFLVQPSCLLGLRLITHSNPGGVIWNIM
jgi:hypothetical protein